MSHSHDSEPNFENLSKAITEAVMTSDKVRKIVEEIQKEEDICPQSFMVLVLKMQVLTESLELNIEETDIEEDTVAPKVTKKITPKTPSTLMGKNFLSMNLTLKNFVVSSSTLKTGLRKTVFPFKLISSQLHFTPYPPLKPSLG